MASNTELYSVYVYAVNLYNGMDEEQAKGDALFLAKVLDSKRQRGWSGRQTRPGPQSIPSKVVIKDGKVRAYKVFDGKLMNANAFNKNVILALGEPKFKQLLSITRQEIRRGRPLLKVIETLRSVS